MKITISYLPEYAGIAEAVLSFARKLLPGAKIRSSISHPPRKILYLTTNAERTPRQDPNGTKKSP